MIQTIQLEFQRTRQQFSFHATLGMHPENVDKVAEASCKTEGCKEAKLMASSADIDDGGIYSVLIATILLIISAAFLIPTIEADEED